MPRRIASPDEISLWILSFLDGDNRVAAAEKTQTVASEGTAEWEFIYLPGIPSATSWSVSWYSSIVDRETTPLNPLFTAPVSNVMITPTSPSIQAFLTVGMVPSFIEAATKWHRGSIRATAPAVAAGDSAGQYVEYYGALVMIQPAPTNTNVPPPPGWN